MEGKLTPTLISSSIPVALPSRLEELSHTEKIGGMFLALADLADQVANSMDAETRRVSRGFCGAEGASGDQAFGVEGKFFFRLPLPLPFSGVVFSYPEFSL